MANLSNAVAVKRGSLPWLILAVWGKLKALTEKATRDLGAFMFRNAVSLARFAGMLPKPQSGNGILVINLTSHFGDGVMLLPMLEAIYEANPGTPIDIACSKGVDGLFSAVPYLRTVYAAPLSSIPPLTFRLAIERRLAIFRWYRQALLNLHPEVCLMPRWGDDQYASLFLAFLIGAPQRIGYASTVDKHQRTAPQRDRSLTQTAVGGSGLHEPLRFLRVAQLGGLIPSDRAFRTDAVSHTLQQVAETVDWPALRDRLALPHDKPFAILAPGASIPKRRWPQEHWVEAAHKVLQSGFDVVLLGSKDDRALAGAIHAQLNSHHRVHLAAGATTLTESIAIMAHAAFFLGSDSGPGHAAGALGVPSVILFVASPDVHPDHPNGPARVRPMGPYVHDLYPTILSPCNDVCMQPTPHCIATISADTAIQSLLSLHERKLQNSPRNER